MELSKYLDKLFETAEIARFSPAQAQSYEDSLKYYRDLKNSLDTAREEGREEGREKGREEGLLRVALEMMKSGESIDKIMRYTGFNREQMERLKDGKE